MTTTAPPRPPAAQGRGRLPAPVRDRRPALAALALLLVLGGALSSALVAYRSGERVDVLVARGDIEVGQTIAAGDLGVARVAADGDAATIEAEALANFVGTSATARIPRGTLLNARMFLSGSSVVPSNGVLVGVVLSATQRPAVELRPGDVVRVFLVPRESGGTAPGTVLAEAVSVAEVGTSSGGDTTRLSLLVPPGSAPALVSAASSGAVAVTRLAPETRPAVSFREQ